MGLLLSLSVILLLSACRTSEHCSLELIDNHSCDKSLDDVINALYKSDISLASMKKSASGE